MSRNLRARIDKLERQTTTSPRRTIWDVLSGTATVEDLDEADRQTLQQLEAEGQDHLCDDPELIILRVEWARLGIADPGQYDGLNLSAEAHRLAEIPTPSAWPCDEQELAANEPAPGEPP
jgi:hypothetical protein